ncbi:hypothetical protein [cf. Phormidesmis sp. LEGE 11477]|uniref:hypothetical protein n=1 Tax=cf. Phormidesmis sp. LEGE 11477 TaxID=1828680 RepID=UPI001882CED5|nr:hypothetical protein [cf. Phormidesmis sp. LEGE 11477]MBE9064555.1 hypothetical protein [cf. Phormidesmis sp. LEGE 11477]
MMQSVKGIYRNGKVELLEPPSGVVIADVIVTFVDVASREESAQSQTSPPMSSELEDTPSQQIYFGMFAGEGEGATEEDFKSAEFHGDEDDGLDWTD